MKKAGRKAGKAPAATMRAPGKPSTTSVISHAAPRAGAGPTAAARPAAAAKPAAAGNPGMPAAPPSPLIARVAGAAISKTVLSGIAVKTVLQNLGNILKNLVLVNQPSVPLPPRILGTLQQPNGTPGAQLQIEVMPPQSNASAPAKPTVFGTATSGSQVIATGLTDADGNFSIPLPSGVVLPPGQPLAMRIRGSSTTTMSPLTVAPNLLGPLGYIGTTTLPQVLPSIPAALYAELQKGISSRGGDGGNGGDSTPPALPSVTLGDDPDCIRVLENQVSFEQFPYGIFFQLIAPNLYIEFETVDDNQGGIYQNVTRYDFLANRTQLSGPISVDEFREGLLTGPLIVGSLGLGYVLRCSQNWTFRGLALGDLVYSLPLAPGEQQQVVVEEQITTLQVQEAEAVYGAEASQASQSTDSSTQAAFQSAFHQAAQGGSSYNTASETGAMTVGGGLLGILGGPSGSLGETVTSGSTNNWMDGLQAYASNASQEVQTYADQQSSAQRRAQRTAMRMASASEATSVTTKTITNHNKLHALTMQYFEVLRLFDVTTAYDGVSLVCLVPMDIVWFLPPGQKEHLDDVITDSDLSNAIQYASQLNSSLKNMTVQLQMVIPLAALPFLGGFVQNTVNNVNTQLTAALAQATSLAGLLSGLGANYATQASEATQLQSQLTQAQPLLTTTVADLQNAQSLLTSGATLAGALYQQLSSPSVSGGMTRQQVLDRYAGLLAHSDVLNRWLPTQYASGLGRLERFASDPRASVVLDSLAEDVVQFSANASVLPFDHVYVSVRTRWGQRIGPVEMIANPPVSVPGQFDPSKAFKTSDDLIQYLQGQRNPGNSSAPTLQASIALPRTLSPSDVVGFEITHGMDNFTYQMATPLDAFTGLFGTDGTLWPSGVFGMLGSIFAPPVAPAATTYTAAQLAQELGPPYLWNFSASLTASVMGNPETYVKPSSGAIELPPGIYPIPAIEVSPLLKYSDLILIENTLQHVLRNMVRYSKAVWTWLTPEERVMLLQPYLVSFPGLPTPPPAPTLSQSAGGTLSATTYYVCITSVDATGKETPPSAEVNLIVTANNLLSVASPPATPGQAGWNVYVGTGSGMEMLQNASPISFGVAWDEPATGLVSGGASPPAAGVALLDCIGNEVLGFYGNCMMVPFSIPQALGDLQGWPLTTGQLEDSLLHFHRQSAPHQVTRLMMPTRGVLGEAMLGHCASGEKIDLTRFWNWQDSPADTAPAIAPVTVPGSQVPVVATAQAPNQLAGMLPTLVNNVNAPTVTPSDALAAALAQKAPTAQFPDMTGSAQLAQLLQSTQSTANQARADQLAQQTTLTKDAIDQASAVLQAYLTGKAPSSSSSSSKSSSSSGSSSKSSSSSSS
jgi:hypothetical protein